MVMLITSVVSAKLMKLKNCLIYLSGELEKFVLKLLNMSLFDL